MTRAELLERLDKAWLTLVEAYAGLPAARMTEPGVIGAWSIKDIVAHVTTWEEESLKLLPVILAGKRTPRYSVTYGGIDAFNAQTAARKQALPLREVLRQRDETHRRLVAFLLSVPEDQFAGDTRFRRRLRLDTYGHYAGHAAAIRRWAERA
jgi:hypothetical protein